MSTRPDLDALAALLDKDSVNIHDVWTLVAAVEPLIAYVRELERGHAPEKATFKPDSYDPPYYAALAMR